MSKSRSQLRLVFTVFPVVKDCIPHKHKQTHTHTHRTRDNAIISMSGLRKDQFSCSIFAARFPQPYNPAQPILHPKIKAFIMPAMTTMFGLPATQFTPFVFMASEAQAQSSNPAKHITSSSRCRTPPTPTSGGQVGSPLQDLGLESFGLQEDYSHIEIHDYSDRVPNS